MSCMPAFDRTYRRNISVATDRVPFGRNVQSIEFTCANLRVGKQKIGDRSWVNLLLAGTRLLGQPELVDLVGTLQSPKVPEFMRGKRPQGKSVQSPTKVRKRVSERSYKGVKALQQCPVAQTSSVTVITSLVTSRHDALNRIEADGKRLASFIERRFSNAVYMLMPEVDLKLAKDVKRHMVPNTEWITSLDQNQIVYKVHFHCVVHVPDFDSEKLAKAFRVTNGGKRSRLYSGLNQVRAISIKSDPNETDDIPDAQGCAGYAQKSHYRPPVEYRMLEGFPEWLWLQDKIASNPKFIVLGGIHRRNKQFQSSNTNANNNKSSNTNANNDKSSNTDSSDDHTINTDILDSSMSDTDTNTHIFNHHYIASGDSLTSITSSIITYPDSTYTESNHINTNDHIYYNVLYSPPLSKAGEKKKLSPKKEIGIRSRILRTVRKMWNWVKMAMGP